MGNYHVRFFEGQARGDTPSPTRHGKSEPSCNRKFLGHRSASATQIYSRLTYDPMRQAMEKALADMLGAAGIAAEREPQPPGAPVSQEQPLSCCPEDCSPPDSISE